MVSGCSSVWIPVHDLLVVISDCPFFRLTMSSVKPCIGCKIGLISKAQNRYEGILYTIDKVNSTVVLAKGECCRPL